MTLDEVILGGGAFPNAVPFRMDNRPELFEGGGSSKVGENAGADTGTNCPCV